MESSGEEKKLQALFSELKQADEQSTPRFARVWNRAAAKPRGVRSFNPAFVGAMALLACAVLSIAVWSRYRRQTQTPPQNVQVLTPGGPNTGSVPVPYNAELTPSTVAPTKEGGTPRRNRSMARRNASQFAANRKLTQEAKAITDWESPTSALLSSSSDSLFSSLPQLNENASGLQSYLPSRPN